MSFVVASPDPVQSAARDLAGIRSSLAEATATVAGPTTGIASAAQDEVSIAISSLFGGYGEQFQALSAQASAFHEEFVNLLNTGAGAYLGTEIENAAQTLLGGGGAGQIFGNLEVNLGGGVTAIQNGGAAGFVSGGIQADLHGISGAIAGAPAASAGQIQTGAQGFSQAIAGFETQFGALATGGAPGLITGFNTFANAVAAPYQALVVNTVNNLQTIGGTFIGNPLPFLHLLATNQSGYAQTIATAIQTGIQTGELANLPATIQAGFQNLLAFNAVPYMQLFINQQIGYAQTIVTSLQSAAQDFATGVGALPAAFQAGFQAFAAGDVQGGVIDIATGFRNLFFTGLSSSFHVDPLTYDIGIVTITPTGVLGDLLPILGIPGQMAQNFTNFIPPSIAHQVAQNFTNLLTTVTSTSTTANMLAPNGAIPLTLGLPLTLAVDLIGSPVTTTYAIGASASAFINAVQTGNVSGALGSLLDAPAVVANGFLNGQATLNLPSVVIEPNMGGLTSLPLGGILTPLNYGSIVGVLPGFGDLPFPTSGTTFGGIVPGLLNYLPQRLAEAIGAPPIDIF
jgi:PE family